MSSSTVSYMTWNAGRLIKKVIKNIQELRNIEKFLSIKADFHCFQEMNPDLNYDACGQIGYECFKVDYNFKKGVPASSIVTLVNLSRFEVTGRHSESQDVMIVEDPKIPHQKFTRFAMVIAKDKTTGDIFNIVNVHLKGGPAGYNTKKQSIQRLLDFINQNAKEGYIILGGDFNINFKEQRKGDYGYNLFIENGYIEDCDDPTLKRKERSGILPTVPNVKYDYCFYKGIGIKLIKCEIITPVKPRSDKFDHYPKINTFEIESKQIDELENDPEFQELLNVIEQTPKPEDTEQPESINELSIEQRVISQSGGEFLLKYHKYKSKYHK